MPVIGCSWLKYPAVPSFWLVLVKVVGFDSGHIVNNRQVLFTFKH